MNFNGNWKYLCSTNSLWKASVSSLFWIHPVTGIVVRFYFCAIYFFYNCIFIYCYKEIYFKRKNNEYKNDKKIQTRI